MSVSEIKLFQILKEKMGEHEAQILVEYVESKIEAEFQSKQYVLATKQDLAILKDELLQKINSLGDALNLRISSQEEKIGDLKAEMKADKSDMIKWMFIFWASQLAAILAIVKFL